MTTPAFQSIVAAGALDRFAPISERIGKTHDYLSKLFTPTQAPSVPLNRALKFKIDKRDLRLAAVVSDDTVWPDFIKFVHDRLKSTPYACINWWNQSLLVIAIAAADARNQWGREISAEEAEMLDSCIHYVINAYDKLISKLKLMWDAKSIWRKMGRHISIIWSKLKNALLKIPQRILEKVSVIQKWVASSPKNFEKATHVTNVAISLVVGTLMTMLGDVGKGVVEFLRSIMGSKLTSMIGVSITHKASNKLLRAITGQRARNAAGQYKTYTRMQDYITFGQPPKSGDPVLKSTLDSLVIQIKQTPFQRKQLRQIFDESLKQFSDQKHSDLGNLTRDEMLMYGHKLTHNEFPYQSPFSGTTYIFSGDQKDLAKKIENAFAAKFVELSKGVAPETLIKPHV